MPTTKKKTSAKTTKAVKSANDLVGKNEEKVEKIEEVEVKEEKLDPEIEEFKEKKESKSEETDVEQEEKKEVRQPSQDYQRNNNRYSNFKEPKIEQAYEVSGYLDIQPEGHGFLRPKFIPSARDIYISQSQIRRFMLRSGDLIEGIGRPPKDTERYFGLLKVEKVNEEPAEKSIMRDYFDDLTAVYPKKQVVLSTGKFPLSTRIIDLMAPIGFGQRAMVVSPPKAGKTTILKEIAAGISQNFPKAHLMAALIGERPEEVTDIASSVKGDVIASNFDEPPENQTRVAEITLERAKRLVETGIDVVVLLDSITRLARAYNLSVAPSGRTFSGGFDPAAFGQRRDSSVQLGTHRMAEALLL